ncbi:unnamed protein product [Prorocentrum cordatum]|uniref:Membrane transporter protein n=1 Tax=Prorocentrum cordatum TaxID=2364126 RepID=A0ABN9PW62_9DINO|nr:unnamed protein product [Polarella glacialis]
MAQPTGVMPDLRPDPHLGGYLGQRGPGHAWRGRGSVKRCAGTPRCSGSAAPWTRWRTTRVARRRTIPCSIFVPLGACTAVASCWARALVAEEGWRRADAAMYAGMACVTGCVAGLVGIGGGLIFSPFFLLMGLEPSVAVATSSTCVIFTSSSTTLQYLLTDRIIVSLSLLYGFTNLKASFVGTSFVHYLQDVHGAKKSFISMIVAAGVLISTALSVLRLIEGIQDGFQVDIH